MIVHDVQQGTPRWLELRLGIPTASEFSSIVTPTGAFSKQSHGYALKLVAERLLRRPLDSIDNLEWVARGKELEPDAAKLYDFENDVRTVAIGFITTDDGQIGASPDRLVGVNGLLEIKAPAPNTQLGYLLDGFDAKYKPQVQGQLMVAERDWCDWMAFHPEMPTVVVRIGRDEEYIAKLRAALRKFNDQREEMYARALASGAFQVAPQVQTAHEQAYDGGPGPAPFDMADEFGSAFA